MQVKEQGKYLILLNTVDLSKIMNGDKVSFWIISEGHDDLTFELKLGDK